MHHPTSSYPPTSTDSLSRTVEIGNPSSESTALPADTTQARNKKLELESLLVKHAEHPEGSQYHNDCELCIQKAIIKVQRNRHGREDAWQFLKSLNINRLRITAEETNQILRGYDGELIADIPSMLKELS